jgi:calreticulin
MKVSSLLLALGAVRATVYLKEDFSGDWESRWVVSDWKTDTGEAGKWEVTAGKFFADEEASKGLRTTEDAKFYAISTKFPTFSNKGKTLVIQYVVKHEQNIDCGGGYMKIFPSAVDQKKLHGGADEDVYNLMFGPDICGYDKKTHVIFHYNGENKLINKSPKCESDTLSHLYTLVLTPDGKYKVSIDMKEVQSGELREDWSFLLPKKIKDPALSKPKDWVDEKMIDDPEDKKPEGWDEIPKQIADPDAVAPDDWDEEDDGVWEPPFIDNPEYKGEWKVKRIDNPEYKGEWVHTEIDNPDYKDDPTIGQYPDFGVLAFEVWQVKSGTIFDSIIITDDEDEAKAYAETTFVAMQEAEKKAKDVMDEEKKKAEAEAEKEDTDDDEDDEDEEEEEKKDEL